MKKRLFIIATAVIATTAIFTACSNDEQDFNQAEAPQGPLTIQVVDNGMLPADESEASILTRSRDNTDYTKQFTTGDEIGIFVIRNGSIHQANVRYKLQENGAWRQVDENGDVTATQLASEQEYTSSDVYFAYYPYQADFGSAIAQNYTYPIGVDDYDVDAMVGENAVKNRVTTGTTAAEEAAKRAEDEAYAMAFFQGLIDRWNPVKDQSGSQTPEGAAAGTGNYRYTSQDLMVACGIISNQNVLIFRMYHQMALVVLNFSKYTTTTASGKQYYTVADYKPWNNTGNLWRLLIHPKTEYYITGARYDNNTASKVKLGTWQVHVTANEEGTSIEHGHYKVYNDTNL